MKTNTGHSEASAAMFSVAKVLIAMEQGVIPATIQFENSNPNIKGLLNGNLQVVSKNRYILLLIIVALIDAFILADAESGIQNMPQ